ncbi:MAG: phospholipid carrier-dependent glycosyltransferase [Chloroflexota bacterium]
MQHRLRANWRPLLIIGVFLSLAVSYSVINPLGEAPDEVSHFTHVAFIVKNGRLAIGKEAPESHQPPLYYLLGAILTSRLEPEKFQVKANSDFSFQDDEGGVNLLMHTKTEAFPYRNGALAWRVLRLFSVILGAGTVSLIYATGKMFFRRESLALGAMAFWAFNPAFLFTSSAVSNDNLVAFLSTLTFYLLLRVWQIPGFSIARLVLLGVSLGLAVLAKVSALALAPPVLCSLLWVSFYKARNTLHGLGRFVSASILVFGASIAVAGWWFARNQVLYGDPLGWRLILQVCDLRQGLLSLNDYVWLLRGLFQTYWGRFGGAAHLALPGPLYLALGLVTLAALAGLLSAAYRWAREKSAPYWGPALALMAIFLAAISFSLVKWTATVLGTDQARLLYPAASPMVLLFYAGLAAVFRGRQNWLGLFTGIGMASLAGYGVLYVGSVYLPPKPIAPQQLPANALGRPVAFGQMFQLRAYELPAQPISAGQYAFLTTYWQVLQDPVTDYWVTMDFVDQSGRKAFSKLSSLGGGRETTDYWKAGELRRARYRLTIPPGVSPGVYTVKAQVHVFDRSVALSVKQGGDAVANVLELGKITVVLKN